MLKRVWKKYMNYILICITGSMLILFIFSNKITVSVMADPNAEAGTEREMQEYEESITFSEETGNQSAGEGTEGAAGTEGASGTGEGATGTETETEIGGTTETGGTTGTTGTSETGTVGTGGSNESGITLGDNEDSGSAGTETGKKETGEEGDPEDPETNECICETKCTERLRQQKYEDKLKRKKNSVHVHLIVQRMQWMKHVQFVLKITQIVHSKKNVPAKKSVKMARWI